MLAATEDLDRMSLRVASPFAASVSGLTVSPALNKRSRSSQFTGCVAVRNGSNGIEVFLVGPRSLRMRM